MNEKEMNDLKPCPVKLPGLTK
uniref:Uncharacterized protein n=1 Tax=Rhizophora mucronata TaxID=61149 RepID=A0A2P2N6I1_RHIMU